VTVGSTELSSDSLPPRGSAAVPGTRCPENPLARPGSTLRVSNNLATTMDLLNAQRADKLCPALDTALTVIRPPSRRPSLPFRELRDRRELLALLIWRDVAVRYKQAALGVAWAVLQPLATLAIFTVVFGRLASMPSDGLPYSVFALCGLVVWTFFAAALTAAAGSLVGSAGLITKVWFPRLLVPAAAVGAAVPDLICSAALLAVWLVWNGAGPWGRPAGLLILPLLAVLTGALAFGAGAGLAALNVRYRDVRHALPFLVQIWMFATPIVWPLSIATPALRRLMLLNPMTGIVEGARAALTGRRLPWDAVGAACLGTLALSAIGFVYFQSVERTLADEI